jgi:hypothetical protein
MSRGETGKQRQTRIELAYYKQPDAIARWRARLILLALAVAGLWFALAPNWDAGQASRVRLFEWNRLASPGPLARVHATWESSCETCHVPFQPMNDSHRTPFARADTSVSNQKCQRCHSGPTHHASQIPKEIACSVCHHDHRGADVSLVRLDDAACTTCHADLNNHRDKGGPPRKTAIATSVTRFDANPDHHPEFRVFVAKNDPGRLRFNHALHRTRGYTLEPGGKEFTFAQIAAAERSRYGWNPKLPLDTAVPPLEDCNSCHRLDSDEYAKSATRSQTAAPVFAARSARAYMLPVTYENHCRACHSLEFDSKSPGREVKHGLSPGMVLDDLRQIYQAQAANDDPELLRRHVPPRRKPGEPESPHAEPVGRAVDDKVLTAVRILFGAGVSDEAMRRHQLPLGRRGCALCHDLQPATVPLVNADAIRNVEIEPVNVPKVWFERARFDHSAHRAVDCNECHHEAKTSKNNTDVLLPGIAQCVQCHGPRTGRGGKTQGGAGDSCTECHRFHNGDHPLQGIGASPRGVIERRTIDQFLGGAGIR